MLKITNYDTRYCAVFIGLFSNNL